MKGKKILIFIDNDIMTRHFIASDAFNELEENNNVIYVINEDEKRFEFKKNKALRKIKSERIRFTKVPRVRTGWWHLLTVITLFRLQRKALKNNGNKKHYESILKFEIQAIGKKNVRLAKIAGLPIIYQLIRLIFIVKLGIDKDVLRVINSEKPDLLLHPSFLNGYFINELFLSASKFKIPFLILVNSWDNPSCNAFPTGMPDKLVVWGEQMRKHAIQYLGIEDKKIECFGAAQFEVYKKPPLDNRKKLANFFEVDPDKKILLYAGVGASGCETIYLKLLEEAIKKNILENCHVIYRPHPWRKGLAEKEKDFLSLDWNHVSIDPSMKDYYKNVIKSKKVQLFLADYMISNKLLTLVDAVISPLSTMLIESMIKGKPVLAFFPESGHYKSLKKMDNLHFAEFLKIKEVNTCYFEKDFIPICETLVKQINDDNFSNSLKKEAEFFITPRSQSYGSQLAKLVDSML